jgi:hypothetical protein
MVVCSIGHIGDDMTFHVAKSLIGLMVVVCSIGHIGHERLIEATIIVQFIFWQFEFHKGALYALPDAGLIK